MKCVNVVNVLKEIIYLTKISRKISIQNKKQKGFFFKYYYYYLIYQKKKKQTNINKKNIISIPSNISFVKENLKICYSP